MKKIGVADSLFLQYGKSAKLGGPNAQIPPSHFEWEAADPQTARFVTDSDIKYAHGPGQVALLLETFFLHPENYMAAMEKPFDYVLTHNAYFARNKGWLWYPHGGSWVDFRAWNVYPKSKDVSILLSPKRQLWGHKRFHEVVERYGERMDVFGLEYYASKLEALAQYRYAIVIEAEYGDSFFSEKLLDCFAVGTMPVYWGCPNIREFFRPAGIIQIENIEQIGLFLDDLDPVYYNRRLSSVRTNMVLAAKYRLPEDWIYENYPFLFE